jgi:hypothetical protein
MKNKLKVLTLTLGIVFAALAFAHNKQQAQTKGTETAGQKFKNIKVLNDMPADQTSCLDPLRRAEHFLDAENFGSEKQSAD